LGRAPTTGHTCVIGGRALIPNLFRAACSGDDRCKTGGGVGIAALVGSLKRRLGTGEIPALRENDTQTGRCRGMAVCVPEPVGLFRPGEVTARLQQRREVECAIWLAAPVSAPVALFRAVRVAALLQKDAEVERGGGTAP
jgi:hypothetical protein